MSVADVVCHGLCGRVTAQVAGPAGKVLVVLARSGALQETPEPPEAVSVSLVTSCLSFSYKQSSFTFKVSFCFFILLF